MTGRYLIYTPVESVRDEKRFDATWRKFVAVCRSLHADGLTYDVQLNLTALRPHVLITASGTAIRRKVRAVHRLLPPPVPVQRCRDRALEASWFLPENRERRNSATSYWGKHQERYRELSGMVEADQVGRGQRIDTLRIAAQAHDRLAHRGEVDDTGHAGEILHDDACRREG